MREQERFVAETIKESEAHQIAKLLVIFQKLPPIERTKMEYYIKGRVDAMYSEEGYLKNKTVTV